MSMELIELIEEMEFAWHRAFKVLPGSEYMESDELSWVMTDRSFSMINVVFSTNVEEANAAQTVDKTMRLYRDKGLSMTWSVGPTAMPVGIEKHLINAGFYQDESLTGMSRDITSYAWKDTNNNGLEIAPIEDNKSLDGGLKVFTNSFDFPATARKIPYEMYSKLGVDGGNGWSHFSAKSKGEIVAFCSRLIVDKTVAVHNVSVLPQYRSRGAATSIVGEALQASAQQGCNLAVLHATPMGRGVYRRMGFVEQCEIKAYKYEV